MALWQEIKINPQDKGLLAAFVGTGLVIMGIGVVFALLMLLVRTPALSVFSSSLYYQALTGHGIMMFIFWMSFIQTAFLLAAGTVLIKRRDSSVIDRVPKGIFIYIIVLFFRRPSYCLINR